MTFLVIVALSFLGEEMELSPNTFLTKWSNTLKLFFVKMTQSLKNLIESDTSTVVIQRSSSRTGKIVGLKIFFYAGIFYSNYVICKNEVQQQQQQKPQQQ